MLYLVIVMYRLFVMTTNNTNNNTVKNKYSILEKHFHPIHFQMCSLETQTVPCECRNKLSIEKNKMVDDTCHC